MDGVETNSPMPWGLRWASFGDTESSSRLSSTITGVQGECLPVLSKLGLKTPSNLIRVSKPASININRFVQVQNDFLATVLPSYI